MGDSLHRSRRSRLLTRALPAALAVAALAAGALAATGVLTESREESVGNDWARAWTAGDYGAMHRMLDPATRRRVRPAVLRTAHEQALRTATTRRFRIARVSAEEGDAVLDVVVQTRIFGTLRGEVRLPLSDAGVEWGEHLAFPFLEEGVRLTRRSEAPPRARLLARDGSVIVEGPAEARTSAVPAVGNEIAGRLEPPRSPALRRRLELRGFPPQTPVGVTGLERALEAQLAGTPGGQLLAGGRVIASATPERAPDVRTTIDIPVQTAAVTALAGRFGGVAALDATTGEVRALAGIAFSAPQPPGSVFKIVTTAAALEERLVRTTDEFPVESHAIIDGVELENANRELCGGTFKDSFAHSCNSVFAPLGVRVGAERLVAEAEQFGFNAEPAIDGAAASTLPAGNEIASELELGATAIGQGRILATPLEFASIAQTIASEGLRYEPTLLSGTRRRARRVTPVGVARTIEELMIEVVRSGTGRAASLDPVRVAGKTGTAELEDTSDDDENPEEQNEPPGFDTNAWFAAYAPSRDSRLAVAVMLVRQGAGGSTAAPVAREVLRAGLAGR